MGLQVCRLLRRLRIQVARFAPALNVSKALEILLILLGLRKIYPIPATPVKRTPLATKKSGIIFDVVMRNLHLSFFVFSSLFFSFAPSVNAQITKEKNGLTMSELPQAEPIYNLLKSLEISDFDLYLSAFESKSKEFAGRRKDWRKIRRGWIKDFKSELREYRLDDLRFAVDIEEPTRSVVFIVYKGKHLHGMNVGKEAGKWKIIEL